MNESVSQEPRIVVNGRTLTPEDVGTVLAGLNALGNITKVLDETAAAGLEDDHRGAEIKEHRERLTELRSLILGKPLTAASSSEPATAGRVRLTVEVGADRQDAFTRVWREFISGKSPQEAAVRQRAADREQGLASLKELAAIAQRDSGQCRRIALFLAGLYNGPRFPFDLTELRAIDDELFEHALAVLRLDHRPQKEVHRYFPDGGELWEQQIIGAWQLDEAAARHAAYLLAGFLEGSKTPELRELAQRINGWRSDLDRRDRA
jgi:hypothetical protein